MSSNTTQIKSILKQALPHLNDEDVHLSFPNDDDTLKSYVEDDILYILYPTKDPFPPEKFTGDLKTSYGQMNYAAWSNGDVYGVIKEKFLIGDSSLSHIDFVSQWLCLSKENAIASIDDMISELDQKMEFKV